MDVKKAALLWIAGAAAVMGQSYPAAWKYVPPGVTTIIGVDWTKVQQSDFAEAVAAEFKADGSFALPDPALLDEAHQVLVASPGPVVVLTGVFNIPALRQRALAKHMKADRYHGVDLLILRKGDAPTIAIINDLIVLAGPRDSMIEAIDRVDSDQPRTLHPLLSRGSRLAS